MNPQKCEETQSIEYNESSRTFTRFGNPVTNPDDYRVTDDGYEYRNNSLISFLNRGKEVLDED